MGIIRCRPVLTGGTVVDAREFGDLQIERGAERTNHTATLTGFAQNGAGVGFEPTTFRSYFPHIRKAISRHRLS
jgi:hypothetical protein